MMGKNKRKKDVPESPLEGSSLDKILQQDEYIPPEERVNPVMAARQHTTKETEHTETIESYHDDKMPPKHYGEEMTYQDNVIMSGHNGDMQIQHNNNVQASHDSDMPPSPHNNNNDMAPQHVVGNTSWQQSDKKEEEKRGKVEDLPRRTYYLRPGQPEIVDIVAAIQERPAYQVIIDAIDMYANSLPLSQQEQIRHVQKIFKGSFRLYRRSK
jgi:hypothetical protein